MATSVKQLLEAANAVVCPDRRIDRAEIGRHHSIPSSAMLLSPDVAAG